MNATLILRIVIIAYTAVFAIYWIADCIKHKEELIGCLKTAIYVQKTMTIVNAPLTIPASLPVTQPEYCFPIYAYWKTE